VTGRNDNFENDGGNSAMVDDIIITLQNAIEISRNWAHTGWSVTFGPRNTEVLSLEQAKALPKNFVFREEALNYWRQAQLTGNDAADSGVKALNALKTGNLSVAADALYFSQYIEQPFAGYSRLWRDLYETVKALVIKD
jgi:hypothetical protein